MSTAIVHRSGTMLSARPPSILPRLIEGRSNISEDSRANGSDSMLRNASIAFSTALSPSHGVELWAARPSTSIRIASTPLASTPICMSVGSPVIAKSPVRPRAQDCVGRALIELLGLLIGNADESDVNSLLAFDVLQRAHHRGQSALHVVGTAADQPIAIDHGLELLSPPRYNVEMSVQDHARDTGRPGGTDLREQHRQPVVIMAVHLDVAGFEPSLHKSCGGDKLFRARGVIRDQPLRQDSLVQHRPRIGPRLVRLLMTRSTFGDQQEPLEPALIPLRHAPALSVIAGRLELALGALQPLAQI